MIYIIIALFTLQYVLMLLWIVRTARTNKTWRDDVTGLLDKLPLNGSKQRIIDMVNDCESPVMFIDSIERELDALTFELCGRERALSPFGSGYVASHKFGGTRARPNKELKKADLNHRAYDFQNVYDALVECKL